MIGYLSPIMLLQIHIYIKLNHFADYLKLMQYCKSTTLQKKGLVLDMFILKYKLDIQIQYMLSCSVVSDSL